MKKIIDLFILAKLHLSNFILLIKVKKEKILFYSLLFLITGVILTIIQSLNNYRYNELKKLYVQETIQRQIENKAISEKVDRLHTFVKRLYPFYDYKKIINDASGDSKKINDLPEDLFKIYYEEYLIKPHGLLNYEKTLKNIIFPMEEKSSFVTEKDSEYGTYRPYAYMGYKHEGLDLKSYFNPSVFAIYNAQVYRKTYNEVEGWTLEIKFEYENTEGVKEWYFSRFRHLDKIYVNKWDFVQKGQVVADMGKTGFYQTGIHLHWELWKWNGKGWVNINPVKNSTWNNKYLDCI